MKVIIALLVAGILLVAFSLHQAPYKNGETHFAGSTSIEDRNSEQYYAARNTALGPKWAMQDYGVSLLLVAFGVVVRVRHVTLRAPKTLAGFVVLAVAACGVSGIAFVFDLFQGLVREEFPPWADSISIPLMGLPVLLLIGIVWAIGHLAFLGGVKRNAVVLSINAWKDSTPWLKLVSAATAVFMLLALAEGAYWYAIPLAVWLYFYLSIAAVRHAHVSDH